MGVWNISGEFLSKVNKREKFQILLYSLQILYPFNFRLKGGIGDSEIKRERICEFCIRTLRQNFEMGRRKKGPKYDL